MKILVDETHNPRGRIFSNYTELRRLLERNGHEIDIYDDFPIKFESLSDADVFILPCCDGSKLYGYEINALLRYVELGHGLFVISHAGGDGGLGTNMNQLTSSHFDITLQSNQVFDEIHCDQEMPKQIIIRDFVDHPITQGLEQICFVAGCSLKIGKKAIPLVRSDADANPSNSPLIAIWEGGKDKNGHVAVSGSYRMFSDYGAGIKKFENEQFTLNIFEWLGNCLKAPKSAIISKASASAQREPEISPTSQEPIIGSISSKRKQKRSPSSSSVQLKPTSETLSNKKHSINEKKSISGTQETRLDESNAI
ncbi:MAG: hypothetical protein ACFFDT_15750, partial [Candidatus Hodarchaeota archaeon]